MNRQELYYNIVIPFSRLLAEMQYNGIRVDLNKIKELKNEFEKELVFYEKEIFNITGRFNIKSSQQLAKKLYEDLKIPNYIIDVTKNYKTGQWEEHKDVFVTEDGAPSTKVECLAKILVVYKQPIIEHILHYRQLQKLLSTYINGIYEHISHQNRVHPSWFALTAGARINCSKPNVAQIPSRSKRGRRIKEIFIPDEGKSFIEADFSQMELRFMAWFSNDPVMMSAYKEGKDLHALTTSNIKQFNLTYEEALKSPKRECGKETNFLMTYIGGYFALQDSFIKRRMFYSAKECDSFIEAFMDKYKYIRNLHRNVENAIVSKGYVENIFGRRRYFQFKKWDYDNGRLKGKVLSKAVREGVSHVIQGSSSGDYASMKAVGANKLVKEFNGRIWNDLYDGLFFEVPNDKVENFKPILKEYMERPEHPITIELPIDISKAGKSWGDLK